jgi:3-oxoacyl-[acyl-carrier protein] reductase
MARAVLDRFGRVDVLVNNAGYFTQIVKKPFEELTVEEWDHCFAVNVRGTWLATRAVVPAMKERRYGKIINTSSMTVPSGIPGFLHYVSSKAAIVGFTRALARELGEWNICVNTITPDYIPHDEEYAARQPEMAALSAAARVQARPGAGGHGRNHPVPRRTRLRLRHRAEPLGERRPPLQLTS